MNLYPASIAGNHVTRSPFYVVLYPNISHLEFRNGPVGNCRLCFEVGFAINVAVVQEPGSDKRYIDRRKFTKVE